MNSFFKNGSGSKYLDNQEEKNFEKITIVLASDAAVGKTAFLLRLLFKDYNEYMENEHLSPTIGSECHKLFINYRDTIVKFIIWDTPWINSIQFFGCMHLFRIADIFFLFYDSSYKSSLDAIEKKLALINKDCKRNVIFALIRNKYDKDGKAEISDEEALEFADKNNMMLFHLSLHEKNETGIKELLETVLNKYFKTKEKGINKDD